MTAVDDVAAAAHDLANRDDAQATMAVVQADRSGRTRRRRTDRRRALRLSSAAPDPPNYPRLVMAPPRPVRFFPLGQQDNVAYDVAELHRLLLRANPSSLFIDPSAFRDNPKRRRRDDNDDGAGVEHLQRLRLLTEDGSQVAATSERHAAQSALPTNEVFFVWEVAPLWRGMNPALCAWIRDANDDFVLALWRQHRSERRRLYDARGADALSTDATNAELELITKYKMNYRRRDDTLLLALASIMCRSYRSVLHLWKRIRVPAPPTPARPDLNADPDKLRRAIEDTVVELEELLISRKKRCDPLDGNLQTHFDAFVALSALPDPLDFAQIRRLTRAVRETAEKELTYLKRRCRYLLDGRITSAEAEQPLESQDCADPAFPDELRPPRYIPIHRNIFTESAPESDPEALYGCHCTDGICSPLTCACVMEGGRTYSPDGSLSYNGVGHVVECNHKCTCDPATCRNRVVQDALRIVRSLYPLQIVATARCGFGVVSVLAIPAGRFVCEYLGQVISEAEAQRLQKQVYFPLGLNYIWTDSFELPNGESTFSIDSTTHGNISRFINHSCDPNVFSCRVERQYRDPRVPQVCFFTKRAIRAGEELTLDYNFDASQKEIECRCGSKKCRKWLK